MVVLDGWWSEGLHGAAGLTEADMKEVATNYYKLAHSDPDVVAVISFIWSTFETGKGTRDLPQEVLKEHKIIGGLITRKGLSAQPPILTSISSGTPLMKGSLAILYINGANFQDGAVLMFSGPMTGEGPLKFLSSILMRWTGTVDVDAGTYRLRIKNPDGQISNAFTVQVTPAQESSSQSQNR